MNNSVIVLIAHNIRSLWNIGTLFRNSDAFGIQKIYLTGYTATPPRKEISKTAIGAENTIPWEYSANPNEVITTLKQDGFTIAALEYSNTSVEISTYAVPKKIALILGHEVLGVSQELQNASDVILHIPMHGIKESLNVSVATGITLYQLRNATSQ